MWAVRTLFSPRHVNFEPAKSEHTVLFTLQSTQFWVLLITFLVNCADSVSIYPRTSSHFLHSLLERAVISTQNRVFFLKAVLHLTRLAQVSKLLRQGLSWRQDEVSLELR